MQLPQVKTREELGGLMEQLKKEIMIEIGVQQGGFALGVLTRWPSFKKYYGIDPWTKQENYKEFENEHNSNYEATKSNLARFGSDRIELIRNFSNMVVDNFKDESIDFIYVDARHDFGSVLEDLKLYYPKLKFGGIIGGHDYKTVEESKQKKYLKIKKI